MNDDQREILKAIHSGEIWLPPDVRDTAMKVLSYEIKSPEDFFWKSAVFNVGNGFSTWLSGCKPVADFLILQLCWAPFQPTLAQRDALDQDRLNKTLRTLESLARNHYARKYGVRICSTQDAL